MVYIPNNKYVLNELKAIFSLIILLLIESYFNQAYVGWDPFQTRKLGMIVFYDNDKAMQKMYAIMPNDWNYWKLWY